MKHPLPLPSQERLRELLDYDPTSGLLVWKFRTGDGTESFNRRFAGKDALRCGNGNGYLMGMVDGHRVFAHRVIWKWVTGEEPTEIDHINGTRTDNRFANLRSVSRAANTRNRALSRANKTGIPGVFWYARYGAYQVTVCGKYVGRFHRLEDAIAARREVEGRHDLHPNHGRRA